MIKLLITGIWISGVALASVYFSVQMANRSETAEQKPAMFGGLQSIRGEATSIPVISDGAVQGYFITRLSYTLDPKKAALMTIPANDLITDALYAALVGDKLIDFPEMTGFDLEGFKTHIRETLNERLGDEVFHDVLVEQIDYLSREEIRTGMRRGSQAAPQGDPVQDGGDPGARAEEPAAAPSN